MPFVAKTPRDAFHIFQDHLNQTLNKTLTHSRLRFVVRHTKQERTFLSFFDSQGEPVAVPLPSSPWYLFLGQRLQAVPEGKNYTLRILTYQYRIQRTPSAHDEAEVRFEYVSSATEPDFPYSRHHVQFHRDYHNVRDGFAPNTLHIPTSGVTIAQVIRFLIADLGVPPLAENWNEVLRESEQQFREWTRWDELE